MRHHVFLVRSLQTGDELFRSRLLSEALAFKRARPERCYIDHVVEEQAA